MRRAPTVGLAEDEAARLGPLDIFEADFRPMNTVFVGGAAGGAG